MAQSYNQLLRPFLKLAGPDRLNRPTGGRQSGPRATIALDVASNLSFPKFPAGLRELSSLAVVPVPKAPMNEHGRPVSGEYNIGFAGQIRPVKPKSKAARIKATPYKELRLGVGAPNGTHHSRTFLGRYGISHSDPLSAAGSAQAVSR